MPRKKILYVCYRCDYQTALRQSMHRHLYSRTTPCHGYLHDVELTTEIKNKILTNYVYHEPAPAPVAVAVPIQNQQTNHINQIIQNINQQRQIINIISSFDAGKKVTALAEREGVEIIELDDIVQQLFGRSSKKFQQNSFKNDVEYDDGHFKDMVSRITQQEELAHSSVLFDDKRDQFLFATGTNEWEIRRAKEGIQYVIETLEKYHLKDYEVYLIRKIELDSRARLVDSLEKYYTFMATFNIEPFVRGKADATILNNEDDENYTEHVDASDIDGHRIVDKYNAKYINIRNGLTDAKKNATYKEVYNIVHQNSLNNMETINQRIAELIQIEPEFLEEIRPKQNHRELDD